MAVGVLDENKNPLMPCSEKRARKLMERGEAKGYYKKGIFCIILQRPPKTNFKQNICIGIDPGSKFNGYSVKSEKHTLLNIQSKAVDSVKKKMEERSMLRRGRRQRKTPYRKCRFNRSVKERLPPSTKSRWLQHLNMIEWMNKIFPITHVAVEDIKAETKKGKINWNKNFSPLEVGKNWFYKNVEEQYTLYTFQGYDTFNMRNSYGFHKNKEKSEKDFYTHCVDAWCIANEVIGSHTEIDNKRVLYLKPLMFHRRKLHEILPKKGGFRRKYGGTISDGLKRGTLVVHNKWGRCYVGGSSKGKISLHNINNGKRLCQNAKKEDLKILTIIRNLQEQVHSSND